MTSAKAAKQKLKRLQRELSELDKLIEKHTYPPIIEKQYYHPACSVYLMEDRQKLLQRIRKAYQELHRARQGFFRYWFEKIFGSGTVAHVECVGCNRNISTTSRLWIRACPHVKVRMG